MPPEIVPDTTPLQLPGPVAPPWTTAPHNCAVCENALSTVQIKVTGEPGATTVGLTVSCTGGGRVGFSVGLKMTLKSDAPQNVPSFACTRGASGTDPSTCGF